MGNEPQQQESWVDRFDNQFHHEESVLTHSPCNYLVGDGDGECNCQIGEIKTFISTERQRVLNEVLKIMKKYYDQYPEQPFARNLLIQIEDDLLQALKEELGEFVENV